MNYSIGVLTTVTLLAAFVYSGCDSQSDKRERTESTAIEANRDMEIAASEIEAEFRIYRIENENRLKEYERAIEEIKQEINNEPDREVKDRLESKLEEIEENHSGLKSDMDDYEVSESENWEDFKDSFSNKMDDLGDSLEEFFSSSSSISSTNQP